MPYEDRVCQSSTTKYAFAERTSMPESTMKYAIDKNSDVSKVWLCEEGTECHCQEDNKTCHHQDDKEASHCKQSLSVKTTTKFVIFRTVYFKVTRSMVEVVARGGMIYISSQGRRVTFGDDRRLNSHHSRSYFCSYIITWSLFLFPLPQVLNKIKLLTFSN